jgi:AcrR family transcriptional regulator
MVRSRPAKLKTRVRLQPDERRRLIVEAAFRSVAQEGFEGLRTRDIAETVGINSATLHHYFETKVDLVKAIAELLEQRLENEHVPDGKAPLNPFGRQFADFIFYRQTAPELLAVYREFVARAPRDAVINKLVEKLHAGWKESVVSALKESQRQGLLRSDIDLDALAGLVVSTTWGMVTGVFASAKEFEEATEQLRALVKPPEVPPRVARATVRR